MRKTKELAYEKCCFYCERSTRGESEETVYCNKKKADVPAGQVCHSFSYDLLRRKPEFPMLPEIELPTLD